MPYQLPDAASVGPVAILRGDASLQYALNHVAPVTMQVLLLHASLHIVLQASTSILGGCLCVGSCTLLASTSTMSKRLPDMPVLQIQSDRLDIDSKLLGDCLMSVAVFEAWQEPLYLHMVAQARVFPLAAYGMRSLRQTYQVSAMYGWKTVLRLYILPMCNRPVWLIVLWIAAMP